MLIFSQDRTALVNLDVGIFAITAQGNIVVATEGQTKMQIKLGEYRTSDEAQKVLAELADEYATYYRTDGGPLATMDAYAQPFMFEPPKVYKMPAYR